MRWRFLSRYVYNCISTNGGRLIITNPSSFLHTNPSITKMETMKIGGIVVEDHAANEKKQHHRPIPATKIAKRRCFAIFKTWNSPLSQNFCSPNAIRQSQERMRLLKSANVHGFKSSTPRIPMEVTRILVAASPTMRGFYE